MRGYYVWRSVISASAVHNMLLVSMTVIINSIDENQLAICTVVCWREFGGHGRISRKRDVRTSSHQHCRGTTNGQRAHCAYIIPPVELAKVQCADCGRPSRRRSFLALSRSLGFSYLGEMIKKDQLAFL